jgi:exonuclease III
MKILVWNCRGLGQPRTVQELCRLVREHRPNLVFLSETRQNKALVESVCRRIGFSNCLPVCVEGKGGGIALFVSSDLKIDLLNFG